MEKEIDDGVDQDCDGIVPETVGWSGAGSPGLLFAAALELICGLRRGRRAATAGLLAAAALFPGAAQAADWAFVVGEGVTFGRRSLEVGFLSQRRGDGNLAVQGGLGLSYFDQPVWLSEREGTTFLPAALVGLFWGPRIPHSLFGFRAGGDIAATRVGASLAVLAGFDLALGRGDVVFVEAHFGRLLRSLHDPERAWCNGLRLGFGFGFW